MLVCIILTSGGCCRACQIRRNAETITYKTNTVTGNHGGRRNPIKDFNRVLKRCDELIVASSEITEGLCLLLNSLSDGLHGVAALELVGKWMLDEIDIRLLFILLQSRLK